VFHKFISDGPGYAFFDADFGYKGCLFDGIGFKEGVGAEFLYPYSAYREFPACYKGKEIKNGASQIAQPVGPMDADTGVFAQDFFRRFSFLWPTKAWTRPLGVS
jgi:hypothetical protein